MFGQNTNMTENTQPKQSWTKELEDLLYEEFDSWKLSDETTRVRNFIAKQIALARQNKTDDMVQIIESIPTTDPDRESDEYDAGRKDMQVEIFNKLKK
jgi:hypothetical protein